jgi:hypothetical protein
MPHTRVPLPPPAAGPWAWAWAWRGRRRASGRMDGKGFATPSITGVTSVFTLMRHNSGSFLHSIKLRELLSFLH